MARFDDDEKKNNTSEGTKDEIKETTIDETKGIKLIANGTYVDASGEKYYAGEEMLVTEEEAKELLKIGLAYVPEQPEKKGRNRK
jgi:hypothetical protein